MSDNLELRLGRIEDKIDGVAKDVAEMRGERNAGRRWMVVLTSILAAVIGAITGSVRH